MRFDSSRVMSFLSMYREFLPAMLRTSWSREITLSMEGVYADQNEDTSVQFFSMAQSWLDWEIKSVGGVLGKLLILATLCFLGALCLLIALVKVLLWATGFILSFPIVLLCAIKFEEKQRLLPT